MSSLPDPEVCEPPIFDAARRERPDDATALLLRGELGAVFQPILRMREGALLGYEGLIRGPQGSPLRAPDRLFEAARARGLGIQVEHRCCRVVIRRFAALGLPGRLFLNISPMALPHAAEGALDLTALLAESGLDPARLVIEITEQHQGEFRTDLTPAVTRLRARGVQFAIDDLGSGFSNLGRWLDLRPEFIKTDKVFTAGIQDDLLRQQVLRSVCDIATVAGAVVVAEGVESLDELACVADLGVACAQGYCIERPTAEPARTRWSDLTARLAERRITDSRGGLESEPAHDGTEGRALQLLRRVPCVSSVMPNEAVFDLFRRQPELHTVPVVDEGMPVGVLTRASLIERFSLPFQRELYGPKPCRLFMDAAPLIVDMHTPLMTLSRWLAEAEGHGLVNDFIITGRGRYLGIGASQDLLQALNRLQLRAAQHANPLTQLPGNVPIDRRIQRFLADGLPFVVCHADLDHFKPFNDVFGYRCGDDAIQLLGRVLSAHADAGRDFLGHIGGDDFILLFRSADWQARCESMLDDFSQGMARLLDGMGRAAAAGYEAEDRQGQRRRYDPPTLSLGAVRVEPGAYQSRHQIAQAASEAKAQAKKRTGPCLYVERRQPSPLSASQAA
ncbi:GGDEF domain-containing protein [Castellaniella sp.]|uniref:GGDEF domain-containing protein n=1 Tax=Castellaniella sp. TaxID=1955812 RepID=UPI002AFF1490|nr:GGDEF domain-containing protein [Castellaniella sp.]